MRISDWSSDVCSSDLVLFPWIADLARHPTILDAVEDLLGPNLLCFQSIFFTKEAKDPGFVSWHQDSTYGGLSTAELATVWLAFTPSTREIGRASCRERVCQYV